jgi:hypothetical protein
MSTKIKERAIDLGLFSEDGKDYFYRKFQVMLGMTPHELSNKHYRDIWILRLKQCKDSIAHAIDEEIRDIERGEKT